ncbi:MAG: NADH-quinone oxidoreductase subunit C [Elusimicrobiota bacterium]
MTEVLTREHLEAKFAAKFPDAGKADPEVKDYLTMRLASAEELAPVVEWLKGEMGFGYLDMVTAVDWHGPVDLKGYIREPNPNVFRPDGEVPAVLPPRKGANVAYRDAIELVYCLTNLDARLKVFLKVDVPRDGGRAPSLARLFDSADWQEREVFDLLGVAFEGHPNLKKILTPDFMRGHPLRKDYVHEADRFD